MNPAVPIWSQQIISHRNIKEDTTILLKKGLIKCLTHNTLTCTVKPVLSGYSKIRFQDRLLLNAGQKYCRMLQWEHSAILSIFIKLPIVIRPLFCLFLRQVLPYIQKTFILSKHNNNLSAAVDQGIE